MASIIKVDTIQTAAGGTPTAADLGLNVTGSVLQVVQDVNGNEFSLNGTSTAYFDSPLSITITPKSSTSKFLIQWCFENIYISGSGQGISCRVTKDGSPLFTPGVGYSVWSIDTGTHYNYNNMYFDESTHTTSPITYTIQARLYTDNNTRVDFNDAGYFQDTMIIQEIAG